MILGMRDAAPVDEEFGLVNMPPRILTDRVNPSPIGGPFFSTLVRNEHSTQSSKTLIWRHALLAGFR